MTKRRSLTSKEREAMYEAQQGLCGCGCAQDMDFATAEAEHYVCVWLGNEEKPDSLWRPDCHKRKTKRDAAERARAKRLERKRLGTWPATRHPMQSRGFDKSLRKKMSGEVVRVDG